MSVVPSWMRVTGLINAADCKDWTQFAAETGKAADTASMSSESLDDVWCITDEQREYYVRQFTLMQDDLHGVISGNHISLIVIMLILAGAVGRVAIALMLVVQGESRRRGLEIVKLFKGVSALLELYSSGSVSCFLASYLTQP